MTLYLYLRKIEAVFSPLNEFELGRLRQLKVLPLEVLGIGLHCWHLGRASRARHPFLLAPQGKWRPGMSQSGRTLARTVEAGTGKTPALSRGRTLASRASCGRTLALRASCGRTLPTIRRRMSATRSATRSRGMCPTMSARRNVLRPRRGEGRRSVKPRATLETHRLIYGA